MMGIGTLVNAAGIIIGGCIGLAFKKGLPERFRSLMFDAAGAAVFFIGISGVMSACLKASQDGSLSSEGTMVMLLSLVVGSVIGEAIRIDRFFDFVSDRLKKAFSCKAGNIGEGFASTTILFCAGAMAIIGAIEDGAMGNPDLAVGAAFRDQVTSEPDVLECYSVTGEYDYQLKIITASTASLEQLLARIKAAVGVSKTSTAIILSTVKLNFPIEL